MVKIFSTLAVMAILASGCASNPSSPNVEFREKEVPVFKVPVPPTVDKPVLQVESLTTEQMENPNLVSQAYVLSLVSAELYALQLKTIVDKYKELSKNNTEILNVEIPKELPTKPTP